MKKYTGTLGFRVNHTKGISAEKSVIGFPHYSNEYMMYCFVSGSGSVRIEGKRYNFSAGDVVILNPTELFNCTIDDNVYHERVVFHFNESITSNFDCDCDFLYDMFDNRPKGEGNLITSEDVYSSGCSKILEEIISLLDSESKSKQVHLLCKIIEFLIKLNNVAKTRKYENNVKTNPLINDVINYISNGPIGNITIEGITKKFNISKSYLEHRFKEYVGTSLWDYVIMRRIRLFNNFLKRDYSIEEASRMVGFANYSNFFRLYKKRMNMTPSEFKKTLIEKNN